MDTKIIRKTLAVELSQNAGGIWFATCPRGIDVHGECTNVNPGMGETRTEALRDMILKNAILGHYYINAIVEQGGFDPHAAMLLYRTATRSACIYTPSLDGKSAIEAYMLEAVYALARDLMPVEVTADPVLAEVIELFAMEIGEYESEDAILYLAPHADSYEAINPKASPLLYKWLVGTMRDKLVDEAVVYYFAGGESKTLGEAFLAAEQCGADLIEGFSRDGEMLHRYQRRSANRGGLVWTTDIVPKTPQSDAEGRGT